MRILFPAAPGYGLMLPIVPLVWAARAAGHEVLVATTAYVAGAAAQCGLPTVDVFPARDVGADLMQASDGRAPEPDDAEPGELPQGYWRLARELRPFELFALAMTDGTIIAGRDFGADLVVYPADHVAGMLAAVALGTPAMEVGNRISWSMRDDGVRTGAGRNARTGVVPDDAPVIAELRERHDLGARTPSLVARVDPRPPSLGGLERDQLDPRDHVPWWSMRYVPYNGGGLLETWALRRPKRPRICLTLGTVAPLLSDGSLLSQLLRALGGLDAEVILADHSTDLSRLGTLPVNVTPAGYLPLSSFLDTCALVVHHGGSGTAAAALHHGIPQLLLPDGADNPLVAQRVVDCGAGLSLPPAQLDVPTVRRMVGRLLTERRFSLAAAAVSREMAAQPTPAATMDRLVAQASVGQAALTNVSS